MPRPVFPPGTLGAGWGGPAKGPGNGNPRAQDFAPGQRIAGNATYANHDPDEQQYRRDRKAYKRELRERMMQVLINSAEDETNVGAARVLAAKAVLDRIDGKPVPMTQLVVTDDVSSLTDEELNLEIRRLIIEGQRLSDDQKQLEAPQGVDQ